MPSLTSATNPARQASWPDLAPTGLAPDTLDTLIDRHERSTLPRRRLLWSYYRNPIDHAPVSALATGAPAARPYRLAQERGLPSRVTGSPRTPGAPDDRPWARKEVVIENDIAWRLHTMVDFMFGRPINFRSAARTPELRRTIDSALDAVWSESGGIALLQDLALLAHVHGHADLIVRALPRTDSSPAPQPQSLGEGDLAEESGGVTEEGDPRHTIADAARAAVRVEVIEPSRGVALLSPADYRRTDSYIIRYEREETGSGTGVPPVRESAISSSVPAVGRFLRSVLGSHFGASAQSAPVQLPRTTITEVIGPRERRVYATTDAPDGASSSRPRTRLIDSGPSLVDPARASADTADPEPPVVHIQNLSQPFTFEGLSEVEPLIPLQDELNTRLSDRASRVTMSSFRMYLAKGLDDAGGKLPVAPGIVWATDNPDADVTPFGGDSSTPSEDRHIDEIREALDKQSGVPPLAAGVVRAKIGNLSSETALRLTLSGLLTKTARKRITYGRGLSRACALILEALDALGILHTNPADRAVTIDWPEPLPRDERDILAAAKAKLDLGVPRARLLAELGYAPEPLGEV